MYHFKALNYFIGIVVHFPSVIATKVNSVARHYIPTWVRHLNTETRLSWCVALFS